MQFLLEFPLSDITLQENLSLLKEITPLYNLHNPESNYAAEGISPSHGELYSLQKYFTYSIQKHSNKQYTVLRFEIFYQNNGGKAC